MNEVLLLASVMARLHSVAAAVSYIATFMKENCGDQLRDDAFDKVSHKFNKKLTEGFIYADKVVQSCRASVRGLPEFATIAEAWSRPELKKWLFHASGFFDLAKTAMFQRGFEDMQGLRRGCMMSRLVRQRENTHSGNLSSTEVISKVSIR